MREGPVRPPNTRVHELETLKSIHPFSNLAKKLPALFCDEPTSHFLPFANKVSYDMVELDPCCLAFSENISLDGVI